MSETTETAVARIPVHVGMRLSGLDEAYRLSQNLSLAAVLPKALRGRPSDVLAIVLYGQDLGLSPMQAIQGIYVVEGRPSLAAQTWLALLRRSGHHACVPCDTCGTCPADHKGRDHAYAAAHDDRHCTVHLRRGDTGEEHTETATIEQAVKAGKVILKDGKATARSSEGRVLPWEAYTTRLLLARAVSNAARFLCPEVALGFYSEADMDDLPVVPESEVVIPLGSDVEDAEIVEPEAVKEQLDALADQFDFSHSAEQEALPSDVDE